RRHSPVVSAPAHQARRPRAGRPAQGQLGPGRRGAGTNPAARHRARVALGHMIGFRQVDARYPFLWEDSRQPEGRWHAAGDGPAHYIADTPDGAWAEFLRHEEITDPRDLPTIQRQLWAVDIGDGAAERVALPIEVLTGGPETYARCQRKAASMRARGPTRI